MDAESKAGLTLAWLTVAPVLLVVAWLVTGLPLLMAGVFRMGPAFLLFAIVATIILSLGIRALAAGGWPRRPVSWWTVAGVAAVAVGFLVLQLATATEQVVPRRDPGSYVQFGTWLEGHGSLPIPEHRAAFGGDDPALSYASPAFYEQGTDIVPQFMAGLPLLLAPGGWIAGPHGMQVVPPLLGACAVLTFGGLTARLIGPRWAPAGALALALTLPMLYVSRSAFSEAPAMILLLGGLALALDARLARSTRSAVVLAGLGGLAMGLTVLVRVDGLRDVLPAVVFGGLLWAVMSRRAAAGKKANAGERDGLRGLALLAGVCAGAGAGLVEGFGWSRPYLDDISDSVNPLLMLSAVALIGTLVAALAVRYAPAGVPERLGPLLRRGFLLRLRERLPDAAALITVLVMIGFAMRPLVQTVHRDPRTSEDRLNAYVIEIFQRANDLPVDGTRQYTELSLYWVTWYIGIPAVLLGTLGAALLIRRLLRGQSSRWALPFALIAWTTATTLLRPGITPDHPWASRRIISVVIPGMILFAMVTVVWVARRTRGLGYGRRMVSGVVAFGVLLVAVPPVLTSGKLMFRQLEQGEIAQAQAMCQAIGPKASVISVDQDTGDRFSQVVRGMCGTPAARLTRPAPALPRRASPSDVRRIVTKIAATGRRPVILAATSAEAARYGTPQHVFHVASQQDGRTLDRPPDSTWRIHIDVWMSQPGQ